MDSGQSVYRAAVTGDGQVALIQDARALYERAINKRAYKGEQGIEYAR